MDKTRNELEKEIAKILKMLDKINERVEKIEKQMGQLFGLIKKMQ
jgi:tetrahydromethanopterin S-methyltransferase subunit G